MDEPPVDLNGVGAAEEEMIETAIRALQAAGYAFQHLGQKASGQPETFQPGTARELEEAIDEPRKFPLQES